MAVMGKELTICKIVKTTRNTKASQMLPPTSSGTVDSVSLESEECLVERGAGIRGRTLVKGSESVGQTWEIRYEEDGES